ncbi:hypothetical protein SASPL_123189 [Salvia splendens]|uniref:Uncharacterized protein n=1 Tax=Salvia splendens TaxID=180675 RepID=A0A8X8ZRU9_SALSN|nr:hypothetical protein SASPL_123189 [Salvia splendens]
MLHTQLLQAIAAISPSFNTHTLHLTSTHSYTDLRYPSASRITTTASCYPENLKFRVAADIKMSGENSRTKQKQVKETFHDTKTFFHKAFRNVRSLLLRGYAKLPTNAFANPIFFGSSKIGPKLQETDSSCKSSSQHWDPSEVASRRDGLLALKGQPNGEQGSKSVHRSADQKARARLQGKVRESSFLATEEFAKKMEELEMMDESDGNHVQDIDEVVRCYSLLTSPTYLDIVDKFSKNVYQELNLPQPSRNITNSMRKLNSASVHSSMRRLSCSTSVHTLVGKVGSENAHGSMRKQSSTNVHNSRRKLSSENIHGLARRLSSDSAHGSMRKLGSDSIHGSMRKLDSDSIHKSVMKLGSNSVHGSMRKLGPESTQGSMRKLGSENIHSSMRKLGSESIHGSMRKLGSESIYGSMRKLGTESIHGSMRKLCSESIHSSTRKLGSESIHGSTRKLGSESIHGSMRKLGSESIHGSMRKLRSDGIHSSMRCLPS